MTRRMSESSLIAWMLVLVGALAASAARADVIRMSDGRVFEGSVVSQDDEWVSIDTVIDGTRATISLAKSAVKDVDVKSLPAGFFESPPAEPRVSDPKKFKPGTTLYLEVPVVGPIGKTLHADAIGAILTYASRNKIGHIVFTIDSTGGDFDEAVAIYRTLKSRKGATKLHAIISRCAGAALVVPVWCDTLRLLPGGTLGGTGAGARLGDDVDDVMAAQIAVKVVADTKRVGVAAEICRALFDPACAFVVWKNAEGAAEVGPEAPAGVPADKVLLKVREGELLQVTRDQAVAFGMPAFSGGAAELGAALKLSGWTAESDYGQKTIARIAVDKAKKSESAEAAKLAKVKKNVVAREETKEFVQRNLDQAKAWSPTKGEYATIQNYWASGWGWGEGYTSNQLTKESQKQWRTRTDACMYYLKQAGKGLLTLKRLDKEAADLGLEPTFKGGEIDATLKDLEVWINALGAHRNKTEK
jgi:hypothetical protein